MRILPLTLLLGLPFLATQASSEPGPEASPSQVILRYDPPEANASATYSFTEESALDVDRLRSTMGDDVFERLKPDRSVKQVARRVWVDTTLAGEEGTTVRRTFDELGASKDRSGGTTYLNLTRRPFPAMVEAAPELSVLARDRPPLVNRDSPNRQLFSVTVDPSPLGVPCEGSSARRSRSHRCHKTPYPTWSRDSIGLETPIERGGYRPCPRFSRGTDVSWCRGRHPGARTNDRSRRIR